MAGDKIETTTITEGNDKQGAVFEFTAETVKALLLKTVFRDRGPLSGLRMPTPEALATLASNLDLMGSWYRDEVGVLKEGRLVQDRFTAAFFELADALPNMTKLTTRTFNQGYAFIERMKVTGPKVKTRVDHDEVTKLEKIELEAKKITEKQGHMLISLRNLEKAMQKMSSYVSKTVDIKSGSDRYKPMDHWHSYAIMIASDLERAIRSTNPTVKLGFATNDGPVPRFIAAALPMITGDELAPTAIGVWLKDKARETRDNHEG